MCLLISFLAGIAAALIAYHITQRKPGPVLCRKCGTPTVYYCGLGADVDMCPKCDVL